MKSTCYVIILLRYCTEELFLKIWYEGLIWAGKDHSREKQDTDWRTGFPVPAGLDSLALILLWGPCSLLTNEFRRIFPQKWRKGTSVKLTNSLGLVWGQECMELDIEFQNSFHMLLSFSLKWYFVSMCVRMGMCACVQRGWVALYTY
jgi:hypothetical protein